MRLWRGTNSDEFICSRSCNGTKTCHYYNIINAVFSAMKQEIACQTGAVHISGFVHERIAAGRLVARAWPGAMPASKCRRAYSSSRRSARGLVAGGGMPSRRRQVALPVLRARCERRALRNNNLCTSPDPACPKAATSPPVAYPTRPWRSPDTNLSDFRASRIFA